MNSVAILVSDIHLSLRPPVARSAEPDWLETQRGYLKQLRDISKAYDEAPIVCAGDVLDRWNSPPELINFAIDCLPEMYTIPGQHDLPLHSYENRSKSAYWTLVKSGAIRDIDPKIPVHLHHLTLEGFPWGFPLHPYQSKAKQALTQYLAVVHKYCWAKDVPTTGFPGAPLQDSARSHLRKLKGFTAAVFGDNHKGFLWQGKSAQLLNCGTFMRRKLDERDYNPRVGVLYQDGKIRRLKLNCSSDRFIDLQDSPLMVEKLMELTDLTTQLKSLGSDGLDFIQSVQEFMKSNGIGKAIRRIILAALEDARNEW